MSIPAAAVHEDLRDLVETTLRRQLEERAPAEESHGEEFADLWRLATTHIAGGKMIRPLLLLETYRGFRPDREPQEDAVAAEIAALVEQLHFAFLLHDDVIDGDQHRRGEPNIIGVLSGQAGPGSQPRHGHWAQSSALLLGDLLLSSALLGCARAPLPPHERDRLLALIDRTVTASVAGEHRDVGLADGIIPADLHTILEMTADKTAVYSFELPLRCGAILGGAAEASEAVLTRIGRHLGLAFQLQDDLLSAFGESRDHGKDPHSDLREGKQTAIIAYARMTSAWPRIAPRFGCGDLRADEAVVMRALLRECGAERFAHQLIEEQREAAAMLATQAVDAGDLPVSVAQTVLTLLARLEDRRS